ncbi:ceramidase [Euzebya tangerina]|uniref:ceramidase n=1 Tax=Euzebya tangerina TaxID=591198 RepID=UPI0013C2D1D2|nr:ceramidase [Euzebya tangerina]
MTGVRDLGLGDCEAIAQSGLLAQPVNAITSLAFIVAGLLLLAPTLGRDRRTSFTKVAYALLVLGVGVGSVAYHGPQPQWAAPAHDVPIVGVLLVIVLVEVDRLGLRTRRSRSVVLCVLLAVSSWLTIVTPRWGQLLAGLFASAAVVLTVVADRRSVSGPRVLGLTRPAKRVLGVLLPAAALNILGRTGGPVCDPDSLLQLHGVWHLGAALVLWLWGTTILRAEAREGTDVRSA